MDVGLHDDGVEGLIDATPTLHEGGEVAAVPQLGDLELDVAGLGADGLGSGAVAPRGPHDRSLVGLGADAFGRLGVNQGLVEEPDHLADKIEVGTLLKRVEECGGVKLLLGHRSFLLVCLRTDTLRLLRWPDL